MWWNPIPSPHKISHTKKHTKTYIRLQMFFSWKVLCSTVIHITYFLINTIFYLVYTGYPRFKGRIYYRDMKIFNGKERTCNCIIMQLWKYTTFLASGPVFWKPLLTPKKTKFNSEGSPGNIIFHKKSLGSQVKSLEKAFGTIVKAFKELIANIKSLEDKVEKNWNKEVQEIMRNRKELENVISANSDVIQKIDNEIAKLQVESL
jgi:hypothetical protein